MKIEKKKFNKQCKLGLGPQQREFQKKEIQQAIQVGVGAPTKRISKKEIQQAMQVGVNKERITWAKAHYVVVDWLSTLWLT